MQTEQLSTKKPRDKAQIRSEGVNERRLPFSVYALLFLNTAIQHSRPDGRCRLCKQRPTAHHRKKILDIFILLQRHGSQNVNSFKVNCWLSTFIEGKSKGTDNLRVDKQENELALECSYFLNVGIPMFMELTKLLRVLQ